MPGFRRNSVAATNKDVSIELGTLSPSPVKMKFSQSLLWNAVSDWRSHYIAYDALKSSIYKMEKDALLDRQHSDTEHAPLLGGQPSTSSTSFENKFAKLLDAELERITDFYVDKERELLGDLVLLKSEIEQADDDAAPGDDEDSADDDQSSDDEERGTWSRNGKGIMPRRKSSYSAKPTTSRARANSTASSIRAAGATSEEADAPKKAPKRKRRMSTSASEADDWTWRDDRRIMYKRRVEALFTVRSQSS